MTIPEFSNAFDSLLYGYSQGAITLDEYEKSLLLTQAQEQIVVELYTGRNSRAASFEQTEELRASLKNLIKTVTIQESEESYSGISEHSKFFELPSDVLFITYESVTLDDESAGCKNGSELSVVPTTQDEFYRVINNPFKQPSDRKALRLDNGLNVAEIVTKYGIKDYTVRYLSKPTPIILADFSGKKDKLEVVTIDGESTITECKLDSSVHRYILERAVALALASRGTQNK